MNNSKKYKEAIENFNNQFSPSSFTFLRKPSKILKINCIIICGMGGSGIAGNIIQSLLEDSEIKIPIIIHKDYGAPIIKNALYIFISFSGETEEILYGIEKIYKEIPQAKIGVITTGGKLLSIAENLKISTIILKKELLTPREAIGYNTCAVLILLHAFLGKIKIPYRLEKNLHPRILENIGKTIAKKIGSRLIFVYSERKDIAIAMMWKIYMNETAKRIVLINSIPEANHNEIESFKKMRDVVAIFLDDPQSSIKIKKRTSLMKKIAQREKIKIISTPLLGSSHEEKIWNGIILGNWTAFFLAKNKNKDPRTTPNISFFKNKMREQ